jgi:hypothetical protein
MKHIISVSAVLCMIILYSSAVYGGKAQKLETPYWQFTYRGNGEIRIQQNAVFQPGTLVDASSNVVGWSYITYEATNLTAYGVTDNLPFILWVLNSDDKSSLTVKSNTRERPVSAQHFSIICSNASLRRIKINVSRNAMFGNRTPLGGPTWNPIVGNDYIPFIFVDGDLGLLSFNCDLWGTILYAHTIGMLRCRDMYFSAVYAGIPDREIPVFVAGSVTNHNVLVFKNGEIGVLKAGRLINVPVSVGTGLVNGFMDEASIIYSDPAITPKGPIGLLKAVELCGFGSYDDGRWEMTNEPFANMNTLILSSAIERLRVKRICTRGTSVYIHAQ